MMCNKQLSTGEELYIIDENKFVCKEDYISNSNGKDASLLSGTEETLRVRARVCVCLCACVCVCDSFDCMADASAVYTTYPVSCHQSLTHTALCSLLTGTFQ